MVDEREHLKLISNEVGQELDTEEAEFRKLRRDLPGVKGSAAAGITCITVGKNPGRNEFFRTHGDREYQPVFDMITHTVGLETKWCTVASEMVVPLASIGIICKRHRCYFTQTTEGKLTVIPVLLEDEDGSRNEYTASREKGLRDGIKKWVRLWTDQANKNYRAYPAPERRFPKDVIWPDLPAYKVFNLAFRDKGWHIDDTNHDLYLKWSARDYDQDQK